MAKYNAIYEGRLPHAIYNKVSEPDLTCHQGFSDYLLDSLNKVYKTCLNIFKK